MIEGLLSDLNKHPSDFTQLELMRNYKIPTVTIINNSSKDSVSIHFHEFPGAFHFLLY